MKARGTPLPEDPTPLLRCSTTPRDTLLLQCSRRSLASKASNPKVNYSRTCKSDVRARAGTRKGIELPTKGSLVFHPSLGKGKCNFIASIPLSSVGKKKQMTLTKSPIVVVFLALRGVVSHNRISTLCVFRSFGPFRRQVARIARCARSVYIIYCTRCDCATAVTFTVFTTARAPTPYRLNNNKNDYGPVAIR